MAAAPELLPVGERAVLKPLLIPLTALVAYGFGWGLCQGLDAFCKAVFGAVEGRIGWIPVLGKLASRPIHSLEHRVSHYIGGWVLHFENQFFTRWHALGLLFRRWAGDVADAAHLSYRLAQEVAKLYGLLATGNLKAVRAELARLLKLQRQVVLPRLHALPKTIVHGRVEPLARTVGVLEGELGRVVDWDIPRLRARTRAIEKSLDRLWHRVKGLDKVIVDTAFVGAVAVALGRMGLGNLRCTSFRNVLKGVGCGGFGLLETLLSDAIEAFIVADLCDFVYAASIVAEGFEPILLGFVDLEDALIGCHGATAPGRLPIPATDLPPVSGGLVLAA